MRRKCSLLMDSPQHAEECFFKLILIGSRYGSAFQPLSSAMLTLDAVPLPHQRRHVDRHSVCWNQLPGLYFSFAFIFEPRLEYLSRLLFHCSPFSCCTHCAGSQAAIQNGPLLRASPWWRSENGVGRAFCSKAMQGRDKKQNSARPMSILKADPGGS